MNKKVGFSNIEAAADAEIASGNAAMAIAQDTEAVRAHVSKRVSDLLNDIARAKTKLWQHLVAIGVEYVLTAYGDMPEIFERELDGGRIVVVISCKADKLVTAEDAQKLFQEQADSLRQFADAAERSAYVAAGPKGTLQ